MKTTLPWLMRREYWENRGGFLWAPAVTGGVVLLLLSTFGLVTAEVYRRRFAGDINIGTLLQRVADKASPEDLAKVGAMVDVGLHGIFNLLQLVLFFVVFFYLLGALYDDRRDRSVLFWKSLPISDSAMVVSKVLAAAFVAPLLSLAIAVVVQLAAMMLLSLYALFHGLNPITVLWGPASLLNVWGQMLANIPINALWALPSIGWLLLVSAFAKSKPFLWAVLVPVAIGVLLGWFDVLSLFELETWNYWVHIAMRALLGVAPGSFILHQTFADASSLTAMSGDFDLVDTLGWTLMGKALTSASLWIGAAAGTAMIVVATRLRRWRDEG